MAYRSPFSMEDVLEDLPFPLPTNLPLFALASPNLVDTINTAELYMRNKEYRTAAAIFSVALRRIGVPASPILVANLLCKRAECLLLMNYVQHVFRNCELVMELLGGATEHVAFLMMRAHELQGEIQEAFRFAITYQALDPEMNRDHDAVGRLRTKIIRSLQGPNEAFVTYNNLMFYGLKSLEEAHTHLALKYFTEVLCIFPDVVEAYESRAHCFFILGDLRQANKDCNRALELSKRRSTKAFSLKVQIMMQTEELQEALNLTAEWQLIEPMNVEIESMAQQIRVRMAEAHSSLMAMSRSQSLSSLTMLPGLVDVSEMLTRDAVKRPQIRASKQSSGAKPKSQKEINREEWKREKERKKIAQEMEEKRQEEESKMQQIEAYHQKTAELRPTFEMIAGPFMVAGAAGYSPSQSSTTETGASTQERSKKRKTRRKTKNLRAKREGLEDDSDASSVCSVSTCPDDLDLRCPKMPTFDAMSPERTSGQKKKPVASVKPLQASRYTEKFRQRPTGVLGRYRVCDFLLSGRTCFRGETCYFAHSEAEKLAWEQQRKEDSRKPNPGEKKVKTDDKSGNRSLSLNEYRHAFKGRCRAPLRMPQAGQYKICPRWTKGTCNIGDQCIFAHGEKERLEWNEHLKKMESEMRKGKVEKKNEKQNLDSGKDGKVASVSPRQIETPAPQYKNETLVRSLPGVTFTSEPKDLHIPLQVPLKSQGPNNYRWTIRLRYESTESGHLQHIVLLPQYHKCFTLSTVRFSCSVASTAPWQLPTTVASNSEELKDLHFPIAPYLRERQGSCEVEIAVFFSSPVFGNFSQCLVLDFGQERHLAVDLSIDVGSQEFLKEFDKEKTKLTVDWPLWDDGSRQIIRLEPRLRSVFNNEHLIAKYKLPSNPEVIVPSPLLTGSQGLSKENYIDVMHQLLFVEETYIRKQVARFNEKGVNLHATNFVVKQNGSSWTQDGSLYGSFHMSRAITPDDAPGRLLLRNLFSSGGSVLLAKSQCPDALVFEAVVDTVEDTRVIVKLSVQCCQYLSLSNNSEITVDIQFQINRLPLCEMHDNIDRLGPEHVRILFPEFSAEKRTGERVSLRWILDKSLNEEQRNIIKRIAQPSTKAPPLVVFGPFGTGKTFTLNQAVRQIVLDVNNRVLICTHSNSAADLHVELLDDYLTNQNGILACRPLRIYTPMRKLATVSDKVQKYCLISNPSEPTREFRLPTRDDVLHHRVIISTLSMARALFDMSLHRDSFSHILIDEAAQALETETLTPITLAGNSTKVIFTGDHMQMNPDVFSEQARKWKFQRSLSERLFYDYQAREEGKLKGENQIFLTKNYRSSEQVLQFPSDMFYGGKLLSAKKQPLHPFLGPLVFYSALGKEEIESNRSSYRNKAEVDELVRRVEDVADSWPKVWGPKKLEEIGVVSPYRYQVKTIRDGLRKVGLGAVDVETIDNVQGKQFRALFISTVRTNHTSKEANRADRLEARGGVGPYLHFLSDPKLLNTALTRAQSFIAVIGDPFSLRTVGDCQGLWEEFINRCSSRGMLFGIEARELEENISRCGLNINAPEFVPEMPVSSRSRLTGEYAVNQEVSCQAAESTGVGPSAFSMPLLTSVTDDKDSGARQLTVINPLQKVQMLDFKGSVNAEDTECLSISSSEDEEEGKASDGEDFGNADDFAERDDVDETVPKVQMDDIIRAWMDKCEEETKRKESKERKSNKGELMKPEDSEKHASKRSLIRSRSRVPGTEASKIVHEDYEMVTRKGQIRIHLVNTFVKYSERTERLLHNPRAREQECLDPEYLDRLLKEKAGLYRECTLRVTYDKARLSYGELRGTEDEDILIEGSTRQSFDRDVVVVELVNGPSRDKRGIEDTPERMRGKIVGIRHHLISPRERQFVCTVSRGNPSVMKPINSSVTAMVNLKDETRKGVPIYKKVMPGTGERPVRVDMVSAKEALSGKYLFVMQYLQWRRDCVYPLGIVTKKLHKGLDRPKALELLDAEYGVKKTFPESVTREVNRLSPPWCIPSGESRPQVQNAFTIDPPGSRALDDALTIEELENACYRIGVHIADVSYFVQRDSHVDREARRRGTSYSRGHGHEGAPMLPTELSHDICSLLPDKERLAVSVYLVLDASGHIHEGDSDFDRTIVKSVCRLTYSEAQQIIFDRQSGGNPVVIRSVRLLSELAQKRRKLRLNEGSFNHFDHADRSEDIEAHELVEEMMILANQTVAKYLVQENARHAPLRTQLPPKTHKFEGWRDEFGICAKLSLSLRRYLPQNAECVENIYVQMSTWNAICKAMMQKDLRELIHLVCNDNIYPQLAVAQSHFRRIQSKGEYVLAAEIPESEDQMAHWSLNVPMYTHFTSPIRRYVDIEVHRQLLETARLHHEGRTVSSEDISELCRRSSFLVDNASKFEKDCRRVHLAADLQEQNCETLAFVDAITMDCIQLQLVSEMNAYFSPNQRRIRISHLGPIKQPEIEESSGSIELKWKFRAYYASTGVMNDNKRMEKTQLALDKRRIEALLSAESLALGYQIPSDLWMEVLNAVTEEDIDHLLHWLHEVDLGKQEGSSTVLRLQTEEKEKEERRPKEKSKEGKEIELHFIPKSLILKPYDHINVQLSADVIRGLISPDIQLFKLSPQFSICLEHRKLSSKCFAPLARNEASQETYTSIRSYVNAWRPVIKMEAATVAVQNDDAFCILDVDVRWTQVDGKVLGKFQLGKLYCEVRHIKISYADYVCARVPCLASPSTNQIHSNSQLCEAHEDIAEGQEGESLEMSSSESDKYETASEGEEEKEGCLKRSNEGAAEIQSQSVQRSHSKRNPPQSSSKQVFEDREQAGAENPNLEKSCGNQNRSCENSSWVGHCFFTGAAIEDSERPLNTFNFELFQNSSTIPQELLKGGSVKCSLEIIRQAVPSRRMIAMLTNLQTDATPLATAICLGRAARLDNLRIRLPNESLSIVDHHNQCDLKRLNAKQQQAVRLSLRRPFTLIQGPPGTGKTVTGVHIAYWFAYMNKDMPKSKKAPPQVVYCGPSNKSVDVVAKYLKRIPELKILRIYGNVIEQEEYPIPNEVKPTRQTLSQQDLRVPENLKDIALHYIIREESSPFAIELKRWEELFALKAQLDEEVDDDLVAKYLGVISKAEKWAIQETDVQIVLCTCTGAGSERVINGCSNIVQCIVDESAMCLEPETMIPIVCLKASQVVLIGDHKQLQPIVKDKVAKSLGLSTSIFERCSKQGYLLMLEEQYRMHKDICEFPSVHFYENKLKTANSVHERERTSTRTQCRAYLDFWPARGKNKYVPIVFCDVMGSEEELVVTTEEGNQRSKSNEEEKDKVVEVAKKLINTGQVKQQQIAILSPYRAQCHKIREDLTAQGLSQIPVMSIVKSQGSEWDFVIISLVRSLPENKIDPEPDRGWLGENLGFITDEHQINVALTRAKSGLCIIGNAKLLSVVEMWDQLIDHYKGKTCFVNSNWPWV